MNDKFFPELARRLKREGIDTAPVEKDCLPVLADGRAAVLAMPRGTVTFNADVERGPEADSVYDLTFRLSREVYEYTKAMAAAPQLKADALHEDVRLLAEFNGCPPPVPIPAWRGCARNVGSPSISWRG